MIEATLSVVKERPLAEVQLRHIAARAGVGTLVLSHLVPGEGSHTPEAWEAMVRDAAPEFEGEIVCGVDLDEFALGGPR